MVITAMRRFDMSDFGEIDRLTYRDFRLRIKAFELKRIDREYDIALLAWYIREVNAKKKSGKKLKYYYDSLNKLFDINKRERAVLKERTDKPQKTPLERYKKWGNKP